MKFCKDCVHFKLPFPHADLSVGICGNKQASTDPVTGLPEGNVPHPYCRAERVTNPGSCGKEAVFYKAKEVPHV